MWSLKRAAGAPADVLTWLNDAVDAATLADLLHQVIDPEVGINIVDLGLVYDVRLSRDRIAVVVISLTTPGCPLTTYMEDFIKRTLWGTPGIDDVVIQIVWDPPWTPAMMSTQAKRDLGWAS